MTDKTLNSFTRRRAWERETRKKFGINCPECMRRWPNRTPSKLLPGERCKMDGYVDPRTELPPEAGAFVHTSEKRDAIHG